MELRPSVSRGKWIAILLTTGGVVALFVTAGPLLRWCEHRKLAERESIQRPYDAEMRELDAALRAKLAGVLDVVSPVTTGCPPEVRGKIPLVQHAWLQRKLESSRDVPQGAPDIHSPGFAYWLGRWTPSLGDKRGLEERNRAMRDLTQASFIAVALDGTQTAIRQTEGSTFEGGTVETTLVIVDPANKRTLCGVRFASRPMMVTSVRQSDRGAQAAADGMAMRDAVQAAFWSQASERLAEIAPAATLDVPAR